MAEATLESAQDGHNPFEQVMKDVSAVVTEEGENLLSRSNEEEDQPRKGAARRRSRRRHLASRRIQAKGW